MTTTREQSPTREWNRASMIITASIVIVLLFGITRLFVLRFQSGDVFPPYSSLRTDPLGTKALYAGLSECMPVERNYERTSKLADAEQSTLFVIGASMSPFNFDPDDTPELKGFVRAGGRLVLSFFPRNQETHSTEDIHQCTASTNAVSTNAVSTNAVSTNAVPETTEEASTNDYLPRTRGFTPLSCNHLWDTQMRDAQIDTNTVFATVTSDFEAVGLPATLPCHTSMFFDNATSEWNTVYVRDDKAVLIERKLGKGTVVLSSMSYIFSNEAMKEDPRASLTAWLVGDKRKVIFDEYHHGLVRNTGIASLLNEYSLQWLIAGIALLGILFVWKNASVLVPPPGTDQSDAAAVEYSEGKDSASALVNLLRRNISGHDLIPTCVKEWQSSAGLSLQSTIEGVRHIVDEEAALSPTERSHVRTYNRIARFLKSMQRQNRTMKQ